MKSGWFVYLCQQERRDTALRGFSWEQSAVKYANDHFADFPEQRVLQALRELQWPERRVRVGEVQVWLRRHVSSAEQRQWLAALDGATA